MNRVRAFDRRRSCNIFVPTVKKTEFPKPGSGAFDSRNFNRWKVSVIVIRQASDMTSDFVFEKVSSIESRLACMFARDDEYSFFFSILAPYKTGDSCPQLHRARFRIFNSFWNCHRSDRDSRDRGRWRFFILRDRDRRRFFILFKVSSNRSLRQIPEPLHNFKPFEQCGHDNIGDRRTNTDRRPKELEHAKRTIGTRFRNVHFNMTII